MWTKNGEKTLSLVLKQIDKVIPEENMNNKIIIDDHSIDNTIKIAKDFNWQVYENPDTGIPSGANEALRRVKTPLFISFEQDILLAEDWWSKIPKYMDDPKTAVASGARVTSPKIFREIEIFALAHKKMLIVSLDNTIYKTDVIRNVGGFPTQCPVCIDTILYKMINCFSSYRWVTDGNVISLHLKEGLKHYVHHAARIGRPKCTRTELCADRSSTFALIRRLVTSPIRGLQIAIERKYPHPVWVYPYIRLIDLKTSLEEQTFQ